MVFPMIPAMRPLLEAQIFGFPLDEIVKWAFSTPVQFYIGWRFHIGAWRAVRNGRSEPLFISSVMISLLHLDGNTLSTALYIYWPCIACF